MSHAMSEDRFTKAWQLDAEALAKGELGDPHRLLGVQHASGQVLVRSWRSGATAATLEGRPMRRVHDAGVFGSEVQFLVGRRAAP